MNKVGIITMHRVVNYGSALQAWATQKIIQIIGCDPVIIDYVYPNKKHKTRNVSPILCLIRYIKNIFQGFPLKRKQVFFKDFWDKNYCLTRTYNSEDELMSNPPLFDKYLVGSDQVWNFDYINNDSSFFLKFAPKGKYKFSYASSFSKGKLDEGMLKSLEKHLKDFSAVSVREKNGYNIVKNIFTGPLSINLDPTLLLNVHDYQSLIHQSAMRIDESYILVYVLNYAYNPYPYATKFIEEAASQLNMTVVCIDFSARQHLKVKDLLHLHDAIGPCEFLWLFSHASLVITTSFHGTAFAINFNKAFYSIINDVNDGDDRMRSLIMQCGLESRMIVKNGVIPAITIDVDFVEANNRLSVLRRESTEYLKTNLR